MIEDQLSRTCYVTERPWLFRFFSSCCSTLHIDTRAQELWLPAVANQRSAGGDGGMPTTSTWFSPSLRPAPWTAAAVDIFQTAATPTAQTYPILILVRTHNQLDAITDKQFICSYTFTTVESDSEVLLSTEFYIRHCCCAALSVKACL